jgi:predicted protein tyrosine phosphatase
MTATGAPLRVTICGIDELPLHGAAGVTHVLSILDPDWPEPEAFLRFDPHRRLELRFHDIVALQPRLVLPEAEHVAQLLAFGHDVATAGAAAHLLVHCHAGVSRSTAATALLFAQADPSRSADAIFDDIARLRPRAWPNLRLLELGDRALERGGALAAGVVAQYRRVLAADPDFGQRLREGGRDREVTLAEAQRS